MPTEIENPGGVVVEVRDEQAERLLQVDGFSLPGEDEERIENVEELEFDGPVVLENPGGALVEVTAEQAKTLLQEDGFDLPNEQPSESPPAPPAPAPTEEGEGEKLTLEEIQELPEQERIAAALASNDFNTMRSVVASLIEDSTAGMGKAEAREKLEELQA